MVKQMENRPAETETNCVFEFLSFHGPQHYRRGGRSELAVVIGNFDCSRSSTCGQALAGVACRRHQKKYERAQSTLVIADGTNASGRSLIERWAMSAEMRLMAKPA